MEAKHEGLEDDFPFQMGDHLRFQPLVFRGVPPKTSNPMQPSNLGNKTKNALNVQPIFTKKFIKLILLAFSYNVAFPPLNVSNLKCFSVDIQFFHAQKISKH